MSKYRLSGRLPGHRRFAKPVEVTVHRYPNGFYAVHDEHIWLRVYERRGAGRIQTLYRLRISLVGQKSRSFASVRKATTGMDNRSNYLEIAWTYITKLTTS